MHNIHQRKTDDIGQAKAMGEDLRHVQKSSWSNHICEGSEHQQWSWSREQCDYK